MLHCKSNHAIMNKLLLLFLLGNINLSGVTSSNLNMKGHFLKDLHTIQNPKLGNSITDSIIGDSLYKIAETLFYKDQNYEQAFEKFMEASNFGNNKGLSFIGCEAITSTNLFINTTRGQGLKYLLEATAEGETAAMLCLVDYYYSMDRIDSTLHFLNVADIAGNDLASYYLGNMYLKGQLPGCEDEKRHRVRIDQKRGLEYLKKSNDPNALFMLGKIYMKGNMVIQSDQKMALLYFEKCIKNARSDDSDLREQAKKHIDRIKK